MIVATAVLLLIATACGGSTKDPATSGPSTAVLRNIAPTALILDASGSMTTADAPGPRIDAAKNAAAGLIEALPDGTRFALLTYGTGTGSSDAERAAGCRDITTLVPLAVLDRGAAKGSVDGIVPRGYTPIAEALRRAAGALPASGAASIVLVSDGEDTCGDPPCAAAKALKKAHPDLQISTIGFRTTGTASADLQCIADSTGGLYVTAANSAQLRARLLATQDSAAASTIIGDSLRGLRIGQQYDSIRKAHPDFPTTGKKKGEQTLIVWQDCTWVFDSTGILIEIRPGDDIRTVDGIGVGSTAAQAESFYGEPLSDLVGSDGTRTLIFSPTGTSGGAIDSDTAYRTTVDGRGDTAAITTIVLCRCRPRSSTAASASPAATETKIVKDVITESANESVSPAPGYTVEDSGLTVDCYRGGATSHGPSTYQCGSNADGLYNCWLRQVTGWGWCLADPASTVLRRITIGSVSENTSKDSSAENPAALDLASGEHCRLRYGGSETPHPGDGKVPFYYCGSSGVIVWTPQGAGLSGIDRSKPQWQATAGTRTGPLTQVAVTRAWYTAEVW